MGWKLSNLPNGRDDYEPPVEQATAAPGEKRNVSINPCDKCGSLSIHVELVETTRPGDRYRTYVPGSIRCDACGATRAE